jgi:RNA polymerase sigma-70 factor (ECF subfamily)
VQGDRLPSEQHASGLESLEWHRALSGTGPERDAAVERLRELLLQAARFEISRSRRAVPHGRSDDFHDLAVQAAEDALVAVLNQLDTYRGESRFTTWAYKFALFEAKVKVRRRSWHAREVPREADGLAQLCGDRHTSPAGQAMAPHLRHTMHDALVEVLTPQERAVLVAVTLNDVPIDVLAERRDMPRAALYQTVRNARRKLRAALPPHGFHTPHTKFSAPNT